MKKRSMTAIVMFTMFVLSLLIPGNSIQSHPTDDWKSLLEPINPEFTTYMNALKQGQNFSSSGFSDQFGYVPSPLKLSHVKGVVDEAVNTTYPAYYDLRTLGRVSPMKDQGFFFTCWAFASYGSLESNLLPEESVDFSEWHLSNAHGFDYDLDGGGNALVTGAYLLRWSGPVSEEIMRYPINSEPIIGTGIFPVAKHVQQIVSLPERNGPLDNNTIKYFVTNDGPVDFAMHFGKGINWDTYTYYYPIVEPQNHRLIICGWDDNFPASKFTTPPPGNGAFIVKNSWGTNFGELGYWYVSYYEMSIQELTAYNNAESVENYDCIYQYDTLGRSSTWGEKDSLGANVFTAVSTHPLEAVGFYTNDSNVTYEIYVYKNLSRTANSPVEGELATYKTGKIIYPGFFTIPLDNTVPLEQGETFSVAVRWHNLSYPRAVSIEMPIPNHNSKSVANPGESYVSIDGTSWKDLTELFPNSNVCIKAYSQFPTLDVVMTGERKSYNTLLIKRFYAYITFNIPGLQNSNASTIKIFRRVNDGQYEERLTLTPSQIINNQYIFRDRYLDIESRYTYRVIVYDETQMALGKSKEVVLYSTGLL